MNSSFDLMTCPQFDVKSFVPNFHAGLSATLTKPSRREGERLALYRPDEALFCSVPWLVRAESMASLCLPQRQHTRV